MGAVASAAVLPAARMRDSKPMWRPPAGRDGTTETLCNVAERYERFSGDQVRCPATMPMSHEEISGTVCLVCRL